MNHLDLTPQRELTAILAFRATRDDEPVVALQLANLTAARCVCCGATASLDEVARDPAIWHVTLQGTLCDRCREGIAATPLDSLQARAEELADELDFGHGWGSL